MNVEIQVLTSTNVGLLDNIAPDVFDHAIVPTSLNAFLEDPRHFMCLAVAAGTVVGMVSAVEYFHRDRQPQLWINEVGVASTHRCKGIGRNLVKAMVKIAKDRGCAYAWLGTDKDNAPAQACFESVAGVGKPQPFFLYEWDFED